MAMKVLLLVTLVMALEHGLAGKCRKRSDYQAMPRRTEIAKCETQNVPVQLPVPADFDYVLPETVNVQQCTGPSCGYLKKCYPTPGSISTMTYKVHAYRAGHGDKPFCEEASVEVHGACECRCVKTDCPYKNMIPDNSTCECACDENIKKQCDKRRRAEEQRGEVKVAWVESTCTCMCYPPKNCDSRMMWEQAECRCVDVNEVK